MRARAGLEDVRLVGPTSRVMQGSGVARIMDRVVAEQGQSTDTRLRSLRSFWEENAEREREAAERCRQLHRAHTPYGFPKWRSSDPMSASLVASRPAPEVIPQDSRLPQHRISRIMTTEAEAEQVKNLIRQDAARFQNRSKSMEPVRVQLQPIVQNDWYKPESTVEHPSIANSAHTRTLFENRMEQSFASSDSAQQSLGFSNCEMGSKNGLQQCNNNLVHFLNMNYNQLTAMGVKIPPHILNPGPNNNAPLNVFTGTGRPMSFMEREILEQQRREAEFHMSRQNSAMVQNEWTNRDWDNRPDSSSGFNESSVRDLDTFGPSHTDFN